MGGYILHSQLKEEDMLREGRSTFDEDCAEVAQPVDTVISLERR
jgi:hypothetical protein